MKIGIQNLVPGLPCWKPHDPTVIVFESVPTCDRRTDRRTCHL